MMAPVNFKRLALLAWALVNTSLLVMIGQEWGAGANPGKPAAKLAAQGPQAVEIALLDDFRMPARERSYAQTLERPLFVPSRRKSPPVPPPPAAPPPPPPTMQKGQFLLQGTIIIDDMKIAVIKEIASGKERQVVQGYTINGLLLELVAPDRIVFSQYGDQEEVRLKIQPSPKGATPPRVVAPGTLRTAPAPQAAPAQPGGWAPAPSGAVARPPQPEAPPPPPQTMQDRARNPMLRDFYKQ